MKHLLTIFMLSLPLLASAVPFRANPEPNHSLAENIEFRSGTSGLHGAMISGKALAAVPRLIAVLRSDEKKTAGCSSAYISDDGLLVTASHCVDMCGEDLSLCYFTLNGIHIAQPFAVHTQKCLNSDALNKMPGCNGWRDIAVLKIAKPADDFRCFPIAKQDTVRNGAHVVQIGFPEKTSRFNNNGLGDAPGFQSVAQVSVGKTIVSQTCTVTAIGNGYKRFKDKKQFHPMIGGQQPIHWHAFGQMPRMIQHTASINHGNSGGPTLNENGEIIGVLSLIALDLGLENREDALAGHGEVECEGSSFTEPTLPLIESLAQVHMEARCEERRVQTCGPLCALFETLRKDSN